MFVNAFRFHAYTEEAGKRALKHAMKGVACLATAGIDPEDVALTTNDMLNLYEAKFMPPASSDLARARFETAVQLQTENILQWHARLKILWYRAYGAAGAAAGGGAAGAFGPLGEAVVVRSFARGLKNKKVREHVLRTQCNTYDEALQAAQTEQAVIDSTSWIPGSMPNFPSNIGGAVSKGGKSHSGEEPMEIGAMGSGRIQCHTCHQFGHIAKDCGLMKKPAGGAGATGGHKPRGGGAARGGGRKPAHKGEPENKGSKRNRFISEIALAIAQLGLEDGDEDDVDPPENQPEEQEDEDDQEDPADHTADFP
jgi:hypothetical protein